MVGHTAQRRPLADGRWHFQHGPIDCILGADGEPAAVAHAHARAWARFQGLLDELVAELPLLRADLSAPGADALQPRGPVAQCMVQACRLFAQQGLFMTAMAAVAGSVAQALIGCYENAAIQRAYVNNGGDIALHLADSRFFDVGLVSESEPPRGPPRIDGRFRVHAGSAVRGIATSGWRGRSLSMGIADSVTVLAATAAQADAAATVIANAVNVDNSRIVRVPADSVRDQSDLGARLVTRAVPPLSHRQAAQALDAGRQTAQTLVDAGHILGAALCLQGQLVRCAMNDPLEQTLPVRSRRGLSAPSLLHI
jgi:ApbE superfamily uncharacterized protein (UPF0280 family)